ncbi:MAG TPA: hypothetical protein VFV87_05750 [Pirellulaceae bacterium]|nr:hypothetical protein [Pirellulaceae bacterium]
MRHIPAWLWWLGAAGGFGMLAGCALLYGNEWWLSGIVTVSIFAWLAGVLAAIYLAARRRAVILGAVVGSFLYLLLAVGPWFSSSVGPWLLTTRALTTIETQWLHREPPQQQVVYQAVPTPYNTGWQSYPGGWSGGSPYINSGSTAILTGYVASGSVAVPSGPSLFVTTGHWLCGWLAAVAGALAAAWISRRAGRQQKEAAPGSTADQREGENPFAESPQ